MVEAGVPVDPRVRAAAGYRPYHDCEDVLLRPQIAVIANPASYAALPL